MYFYIPQGIGTGHIRVRNRQLWPQVLRNSCIYMYSVYASHSISCMYCQLSCLFPRPCCCSLPAEVRGRNPSCVLNGSPLGPWQYTAELACHSSHLVPQSPVLISESLSLSFLFSPTSLNSLHWLFWDTFNHFLDIFVCARVWL